MAYGKRILIFLCLYVYYTAALYVLINLPVLGNMGKEFFGPFHFIFYSELVLYLLVSTRFIRTFYVYSINRKWSEPVDDLISESQIEQMHLPMKARCEIRRKISCFSMKDILFYEPYGYNWYVFADLLKKDIDKNLLVRHMWLRSQDRYQSLYEILSVFNWPMQWAGWLCSKAAWSKAKCSHWGLMPLYVLFKIIAGSMAWYNRLFYEQMGLLYENQLRRVHDRLIEEQYREEDILDLLETTVKSVVKDDFILETESKRTVLEREIRRLRNGDGDIRA